MNIVWNAPTGGFGTTITGYTVTLKQAGKADRVFTSKTTSVSVSGFTENTAYTVQVKAHVTGKTTLTGDWSGFQGTLPVKTVSTTTAPAITSIRTGYSNYPPFAVQVSAPTIKILETTENSMGATLSVPGFTVGQLTSYVVTVKQGNTVVKTTIVTNPSDNPTGSRAIPHTVTGLKSNTAYTIQVKANAKAWTGTNASTSGNTADFVTAKSSAVAVAKPVVTVSSVASKTAKLTWTKPAVTGQIRAYLIFVTEKGSTRSMKIGEYSGTTTSAQLQSVLKPNTTYTVSVVAMAHSEDGKNMASSGTNVVLTTKR